MGDNLVFFVGRFNIIPKILHATAYTPESATVEAWYREVETDCQAEGFVPGCGTIDHFTALIWSSVTRLGCYSGVRGGFKVVSCRYAPALDDENPPCDLPNVISCEKERIPALVAGRCHPIPGSEIPSIALPIGKQQPGVPEPRIALPLPQVVAVGDAILSSGRSIYDKLSSGVTCFINNANCPTAGQQPAASSYQFSGSTNSAGAGYSGYSRLYSDDVSPSQTNPSWHHAAASPAVAWAATLAGLSSVAWSICRRTSHRGASNLALSAETELNSENSLLVAA
jgi:hypothetical protein